MHFWKVNNDLGTWQYQQRQLTQCHLTLLALHIINPCLLFEGSPEHDSRNLGLYISRLLQKTELIKACNVLLSNQLNVTSKVSLFFSREVMCLRVIIYYKIYYIIIFQNARARTHTHFPSQSCQHVPVFVCVGELKRSGFTTLQNSNTALLSSKYSRGSVHRWQYMGNAQIKLCIPPEGMCIPRSQWCIFVPYFVCLQLICAYNNIW